jgi:hypothetical protein
MGRRQYALSKSIQFALFRDPNTFRKTLLGQVLAFFSLFYLKLLRYKADIFRKLRNEAWEISEEQYRACFLSWEDNALPLQPMGVLGFSGSVCSLIPYN